jgi:hypothetical protein
MVPGTSFKDYPKYHYSPHKSGPKRQFSGPISQSLINISRKTPFIFKGDSGRPRTSILVKITPISRHQHIKITTDGRCLVCRNSNKIEDKRIAKRAYETIFQLSEEGLKEVKPPSKDSLEESKKIRDRKTLWKCSECAVPICRPGEPCWDIAYKRLFSC